MCKIISSDLIIGNFVIESLEKDDFKIEFEKLYDFDDKLSSNLEKYNYYTNFDLSNVIEFKQNYSFLIESYDDECFNVVKDIENFQSLLIRYFRLGIPKFVIDEMKRVSKSILE